MAIRLEASYNYIILTDTGTGETTEYPKLSVRYKDYGTNIHFKYINDSSQDKNYIFSELVDENDIAWVDLPTLLEWLKRNTSSNISVNESGALDVSIQDSTAPLYVIKASNILANTNLTTTTAKNDYIINVLSAVGFVVGQYLTIYDVVSNRVFFSNILAINTLAITLDTPLDFEFPATTSSVTVGNTNMNVDGSVTPQIFGIRNPLGTDIPLAVDITRIMFKCLTNTSVDLSKFGDIAGGLLRGIVLRRVDGTSQNILNAKTNADLKNIMYDLDIQLAAGNQQDGFTGRLTFAGQNKMGAVVRIGSSEDLEIVIQDDLTSLVDFEIIAEGHEQIK